MFRYAFGFGVLAVFLLTGSGLLFARTRLGRILLIIGGVIGVVVVFLPTFEMASSTDHVPDIDLLALQLVMSTTFAIGPAAVAVLAALPATGRWVDARPR